MESSSSRKPFFTDTEPSSLTFVPGGVFKLESKDRTSFISSYQTIVKVATEQDKKNLRLHIKLL